MPADIQDEVSAYLLDKGAAPSPELIDEIAAVVARTRSRNPRASVQRILDDVFHRSPKLGALSRRATIALAYENAARRK